MNTKYISQSVAIKSTWMILEGLGFNRESNSDLGKTVAAVFESAPTANVVKKKNGKWVKIDPYEVWKCSVCGVQNMYAYSHGDDDFELQDVYCPSCGAKMDGGQDE